MPIFLQDYEKLKFLGKGAFAQIYKVRHKDLGYVRAIKVLTEEVNEGEDDKIYKTFLKECSLLLRIGNGGHPNIIRIYQPRKIEGKVLVEMDYIDGDTFESYVSNNKFLQIDEVYRFIKEIGSALAYCHMDCYRYMMRPEEKDISPDDLIQKYGVAHNDIHSNNIMRKNLDGSYVLLDFGLAIQDDKAVKSSSRGDGAAEYIAPEKWSGGQIANEKAVDIYGFGILVYQMLTGQVPFVLDPKEFNKDSLKTLNTIRKRHETERPADILPLRKAAYEKYTGRFDYERDYPEWLEELVFKCLEKKPENRFQDAKQLQDFFISHLEDDQKATKIKIESLQKDNEALNLKLKELEVIIQDQESAINRIVPDTVDCSDELNSVKTELEKSQAALEKTQAELGKTIVSYNESTKLLDEKERELNILKKQKGSKKNSGAVIGLSILAGLLVLSLLWSVNRYHSEAGLNQADNTVLPVDTDNSSAEIKQLDDLIKQKDSEIESLKKQIATLQSNVNQKDTQISTLKSTDQSGTVRSQQQTINSLRSQVESLTAERDKYREQVKNLINSSLSGN